MASLFSGRGGALGSLWGDNTIPQGGVMGEPDRTPMQDARLAFAAQLLAGSGGTQGNFAEIMGKALLASRQARLQTQEFQAQRAAQEQENALRQAQIEQMRADQYGSSPQGIYNQRTGEIATPAPPEEPKDTRTDDIKEWEEAGKPGTLQEWILAQRRAGATNIGLPGTNVNLPNPLIQKWADKLDTQETGARDAVTQLSVIANGRELLDKGIISGFGADWRLGFSRALNLGGADNDEMVSNTEAYISNMGTQVGSIIKQFGSGTGLSNADREYAEKIVAGKITLNETSMRKVLDINERLARAKIKVYNDSLKRGSGAFPDLGQLYAPIESAAYRTVKRTGTLNGRKVVEYSDGTTEYAD